MNTTLSASNPSGYAIGLPVRNAWEHFVNNEVSHFREPLCIKFSARHFISYIFVSGNFSRRQIWPERRLGLRVYKRRHENLRNQETTEKTKTRYLSNQETPAKTKPRLSDKNYALRNREYKKHSTRIHIAFLSNAILQRKIAKKITQKSIVIIRL